MGAERVLVVDDEREVVDLCSRILARCGYEAVGCTSAQNALRELAREPADLLVTDVAMPEMSGLELLAEARKSDPDLQAIIITGSGTLETAVRAIRAGACDFVTKPFGASELRQAVEQALVRVRGIRARLQATAPDPRPAQLERLETLDCLGAGVAHELRTPLGVINNSVYYLRSRLGELDPKVARHLGIISHEVEASNRVISNLAELSQAQVMAIAREMPNDLVARAIQHLLLPPGVLVHTLLADGLPPVQVDATRIQRVFTNLIDNALEAMPGGGLLTIATEQSACWVEFSFTDTGLGIPADNLERIFEPLFTTKTNGMGLGLALAQQLVAAHQGVILVQSTAGVGSQFTVRLPHGEKSI